MVAFDPKPTSNQKTDAKDDPTVRQRVRLHRIPRDHSDFYFDCLEQNMATVLYDLAGRDPGIALFATVLADKVRPCSQGTGRRDSCLALPRGGKSAATQSRPRTRHL